MMIQDNQRIKLKSCHLSSFILGLQRIKGGTRETHLSDTLEVGLINKRGQRPCSS